MNCEYCNNKICGDGKKHSISKWNKCPYHKAYSDVYTNYPFEPMWLKDYRFSKKLKLCNNN